MGRATLIVAGAAVALTVAGSLAAAQVRTLRGDNPIDALSAFTPQKYQEKSATGFHRSWETAPPMIPHSYKPFKITRELNACAYCHVRDHEWMKAPKAGDSHFKRVKGGAAPVLDMRRYFCLQCHAPQHAIEPIVRNTYRAAGN